MKWNLRDDQSGDTLTVEGDAPPTAEDAEYIFSQHKAPKPVPKLDLPAPPEIDRTKVTPSAYEQADLDSMAAGRGKAQTGMEAGTEFTTALTKLPGDVAEQVSKGVDLAKSVGMDVLDFPDQLINARREPGSLGSVPPKQLREENAKRFGDFVEASQKPFVAIPKFEAKKDDAFLTAATKEAANLIVGIPEFFESPMGVATMGVGGAGKVASHTVRYLFAADMVKSLFQQYPNIRDNWDKMTPGEKGTAITQFLGSGAMAAMLTHEEWKKPKPPSTKPLETAADNAAKNNAPATSEALGQMVTGQAMERAFMTPEGARPTAAKPGESSVTPPAPPVEGGQAGTTTEKGQDEPAKKADHTVLPASSQSGEAGSDDTAGSSGASAGEAGKTPAAAAGTDAPEVITHAAWKDAEGNVHKGPNHPAILEARGVKGFEKPESRNTPQFGFVTDKRPLVTREEAGPIAEKSGQALKDFDEGHPVHSNEVAATPGSEKPLSETAKPVETKAIGSREWRIANAVPDGWKVEPQDDGGWVAESPVTKTKGQWGKIVKTANAKGEVQTIGVRTEPPDPPSKPTGKEPDVEKGKPNADVRPTAERQPVENPPGLDVRESAGESQGDVPPKKSGTVSRPEVPASPESGGEAEKGGAAGEPGVRGGAERGAGTAERAGAERESSQTDPVSRAAADKGTTPKQPADVNHVLPREQDWIPKGDKSKVRGNITAIKLLRKLEDEKRNPAPEEKAVLAQYVGWGGLKPIFDEGKAAYRARDYDRLWGEQKSEFDRWEKAWGPLYDEVKSLLTGEEWNRAARSILNAHYSARKVINSIWDAVHRLGFKGGVALEPADGIGHFIGLQPEPSRSKTKWAAVEMDSLSGRIASKLYPEAKTQVTGFQSARIPNNSVDLTITNVPFDKSGPNDPRYPNFSLHNYFIARALDVTKPGGIVAVITSNSTMDNAASRAARDYFAERADLVGAIRLPNNAFKENAGTEVTTDIMFLRKRDGTPFQGEDFTRTVQSKTYKGEPIEINEYFAKHPDMMLGKLSLEGTMHGGEEMALLPHPGVELEGQLKKAIEKLPENAFGSKQVAGEVAPEGGEAATAKIGSLSIKDGKPGIAQPDGTFETPDWAGKPERVAQAKAYIGVRDSTRGIIDKMLSTGSSDAEIADARKALNDQYDAYVKKHGPINERKSSFLEDDVDFPLVLALEDANTKLVEGKGATGKSFTRRITEWTKSKIFTDRTIFPREAPTKVDTHADGYQVSMNFRGKVDPEYIAKLTGKTVEEVKDSLQKDGLAYENPKSGQWEPSWRYLSGQVRDKLEEAKRFAEDNPRYKDNVAALEKVQPEPIAFENISFRLGSTFIHPDIVQKFLREKFGLTDAKVQFTEKTGNWHVQEGYKGTREALNTTQYGIHGIDAHEMVDLALNLKTPTVTKFETRVSPETGKAYEAEVKDQKKTLEAQEKQAQVKRAFQEWVRQDPESAHAIEQHYNRTANGSRVPTFDPPTWTHYPNASQDITLRDHQKRVVTRMLQDSTLLAHAVGTGKTYAMITAAMESRRLGLAKKPMIVVQNATLEQFARSFKRLYPTAKILAPSMKMRDSKNRNRTMSRIATGDWDAVIIPQSFVNMLPDDPARETKYLNDELSEMKSAKIEATSAEGKRSPKAADLQRAIDRLEKRIQDLAGRQQDNVLNFDQLGVDALYVDEAHAYKKLQFHTKMDNIKGLDMGASQRGLSMLMKVRSVQDKNQGRNVVFATGTPVSNTIAEAWNMMRFLRPDILEKYGMKDFDAFAANFGDTVTQLEMTAGGTWKPVTRFAKYSNGPELINAWRAVADVVTPEEVNLPGLPALRTGKVQPVTIKQTPLVTAYVAQLRDELAAFDAMSGREKRDNSHIPLVVFGRARKATLDMRLIDSNHPDEPGNKLNTVADQVAQIYKDSENVKGTQMVFSDLFQNPDGKFNLYEALRDKLIKRGVDPAHILIVTDELKEAKREAAFQKLNDGDIRIAIGSTERMGTGINAQEHMIGLHHMDAPARPMDIEQRNGRGLRQGNQNPIIDIKSYGVENTLDAALFQRLSTKQRFINQILRGDVRGRNFEDAANEVSMSFDEQMAAFSGDPLALEKVSLENQVRNLEALKSGHFEQIRQARGDLKRLTETSIPYTEKDLARSKEQSKQLKAEYADMDNVPVKFGDRTFSNKKEAVKFLDERFGAISDHAKKEVLAEHAADGKGHTFTSEAKGFQIGSKKISLHVFANHRKVWVDEAAGKAETQANARISWKLEGTPHGGEVTTGNGFYSSFGSVLEYLTDKEPPQIEADLASKKRQVLQLQSFVGQPFERESELAGAQKRYSEVLDKIQHGGAKPVKTEVSPLGMEVERSKPTEAQRNQIHSLLDRIDAIKEERELPDNYKATIVDALNARLREIEQGMMDEAKKPAEPGPGTGEGPGTPSDVGPGMGGAIPSEFEGKGDYVSNMFTAIDKDREQRGLEPMAATIPRKWSQDRAKAESEMRKAPDWAQNLIHEVWAKPRPLLSWENMGLVLHRAKLTAELNNAYRRIFDAHKDGRTEDQASARIFAAGLSDRILQLDEAVGRNGTASEAGRSLNAQKMALDDDMELTSMILHKEAETGRKMTDPENAKELEKIKKMADDWKANSEALQKALDEHDAKLAKAEMDKAIAEAKANKAPTYDKRILDYAENIVGKLEKAGSNALARAKAKASGAQVGSIPDPTIIADLAIWGAGKIARASLDAAKFADELVKEMGEAFREHAPAIFAKANELIEASLKDAPEPVKRAVKGTDAKQRMDSIKSAIKNKVDKGQPEAARPYVGKLVRELVEANPKITANELADQVWEVLKESMPDITRLEAMDAVSGRGIFTLPNQEHISKTIRDLKQQLRLIGHQEDVVSGEPLPRTGPQRDPMSDEARREQQKLGDLMRRYGVSDSDPATTLKSVLQSRKTALKNQIADLEYQIEQGQKIVKGKTASPTDPELEALKNQRDEAKARFDQMFPKPGVTDSELAAREAKSLDREIAEVERQLKEGDIFPGGKKVRPTYAENEARKAHLEALKSERDYLRDSIQPGDARTYSEKALAALKASVRRTMATNLKKIADKDYSTKSKPVQPLDAELLKLRAESQRIKDRWSADKETDRLANRTNWEKTMDFMSKWRRAGVLSSPMVLPKLLSAGIQRMAFTPMEEVIGAAYGHVPGVSKVAETAPLEAGVNLTAEMKAVQSVFSKGMADAADVMKTGKSELDLLYGKPGHTYTGEQSMASKILDFPGRLHGMIKAPVKRAAFERAYEKLAGYYVRLDPTFDLTDPVNQTRIGVEAFKAAERSIFLQDNILSDAFRAAVNRLERPTKETQKPTKTGKAIATTLKLALPIVKVPTNIAAETFQYATGLATGPTRILMAAFTKGVDQIKPEEADIIMRELKKGTIGGAFLLLGYFNPTVFGGYYQPGKKREKGDVPAGSMRVYGHDVPSWLLHNPLLETVQLGSTVRRVADSKLRKKDTEKQGLASGIMSGAMGLTDEIPFMREMAEIEKARNPYTRANWVDSQLTSVIEPQVVQWLAKQTDKKTPFSPFEDTTKRNPQGIGQNLKMGVPVLREQVPVSNKP